MVKHYFCLVIFSFSYKSLTISYRRFFIVWIVTFWLTKRNANPFSVSTTESGDDKLCHNLLAYENTIKLYYLYKPETGTKAHVLRILNTLETSILTKNYDYTIDHRPRGSIGVLPLTNDPLGWYTIFVVLKLGIEDWDPSPLPDFQTY